MISLEQLKRIDPKIRDLSDEQIELVRAKLYILGQLMFDEWIKTKAVPNHPVGLSQTPGDSCIIKP